MVKIMKILVVLVFVLISLSFVSSAIPMTVEIKCSGCDKFSNDIYYVQKDKEITLTANVQNNVGNLEYEWKRNGEVVLTSSKSYSFVFKENAEYTLKVSDNLGYIIKSIIIVESSSPVGAICAPSFTIIKDTEKSELAQGEVLSLEMKLQRRHGCSGFLQKWESNNPDVEIFSPTSLKTEIKVKKDARTGMSAKITAMTYIEKNNQRYEQSITLAIVGNTKPKVVDVSYSEPFSYSNIVVSISKFTTGTNTSENDDFITHYEFILKNETGKVVDRKADSLKKGSSIPSVKVKAKEKGLYSLEVKIIDSHGLSSDVMRVIVPVEKGTTGKDFPVLIINNSFSCDQHKICKIDASKTIDYDKDVSSFSFCNGKEDLRNEDGICSGSICNTIFTYPGTYKITVMAGYFQGKTSSKTVTVTVRPSSAISTSTSAPATTPSTPAQTISTPTPIKAYAPLNHQPPPPKESNKIPGMEGGMAIAVIITAVVFIKRGNK